MFQHAQDIGVAFVFYQDWNVMAVLDFRPDLGLLNAEHFSWNQVLRGAVQATVQLSIIFCDRSYR